MPKTEEHIYTDAFKYLKEELLQKDYSVTYTGLSYRVINHWNAEDLLLNKTSEAAQGKWRKFSFLEILWLKIVEELRNYGLPLEKLRKLRSYLLQEVPMDEEDHQVSLLFLIAVEAILGRSKVLLEVDRNSHCRLVNLAEGYTGSHFSQNSYITVSLGYLLLESAVQLGPEAFERFLMCSANELELINYLIQEQVEELRIKEVEKEGISYYPEYFQSRQHFALDMMMLFYFHDYQKILYELNDGKEISFRKKQRVL